MKTALLTTLSLLAFAGNSILCRWALAENEIDAASFTNVRLVSGALVLWLLLTLVNSRRAQNSSNNPKARATGSWLGAVCLFTYAAGFSFAYLTLDTGTGALILFSAVQVTMVVVGIASGNRPSLLEYLGLLVAMAGLVVLVFPGLQAPPVMGLALMIIAGLAWAGYTLLGRSSVNPLADTAYNFIRTLPMVALLFFVAIDQAFYSARGLVLAVASGALASGLGYSIWYLALANLTTLRAAVVQLSVPLIAAVGGIVFVAETPSIRLLVAGILIVGGMLMVITTGHIRRTHS
jgi:drug/metabolite transporter (DMT)-like permease